RSKRHAATPTSGFFTGPPAAASANSSSRSKPASPPVLFPVPPFRMAKDTVHVSKAERRRLQTLERRSKTATEVVKDVLTVRPTQSFAAQTLTQALPRELME